MSRITAATRTTASARTAAGARTVVQTAQRRSTITVPVSYAAMPSRIADYDMSTGVSATGGLIDSVVDQSGVTGTATGTTTTRPTLVANACNGKSVARFGGAHTLTLPNGWSSWNGITIFLVGMTTAAGSGNRFLDLSTNSYTDVIAFDTASNIARIVKADGAGTFSSFGNANGWTPNQYAVQAWTEDSSGRSCIVTDGRLVTTAKYSYGQSAVTRRGFLGNDPFLASPLSGDICRVIICNRAYGMDELQYWSRALATDWGIRQAPFVSYPVNTGTIPSSFFGMHVNHSIDGSPATPWPAWFTGALRLPSTTSTQWASIHTGASSYTWTDMDTLMNAHSGKVIYNVSPTPSWCVGAGHPSNKGSYAPDDFTNLTNFITTLINRYPGRFAALEVRNEPDSGWLDTMANLVTYAATIRAAALAVDATIKIVSPSWSEGGGTSSLDNFDSFLSAGGYQYIDAVAYHFYINGEQPEKNMVMHRSLRERMDRYGIGTLPIYDTEGWWDDGSGTFTYTTAEQAAYPARMALVDLVCGAQLSTMYAWDVRNLGINYTNSDNSLTVAGTAWRTLYGWLVGRRVTTFSGAGTVYTVTLDNGQHIVWDTNTNGSTFAIPAAWGATNVKDLAGGTTAINGATTWSIGVQPLLFT